MNAYLRHGFPGERLNVLPRPLVREALNRDPTSKLVVTDAGYFPHAARHRRDRREGSPQAIVILCVEGAGRCEIAGRQHDVNAGRLVVIPPHAPHSYYADANRPWSIWWLHLEGADVDSLLRAIGLTVEQPTAVLSDAARIFDLAASICDDLSADETAASLTAAAGSAWNLLARIAAQQGTRHTNQQPITRVQIYLREHLAEAVRVPTLAAMAGFSTSYFSTRFRETTGYSVGEYVKRLRMEHARHLLSAGECPVAEIAARVGYTDPSYFSRQFSAVHQVSPRAFRARSLEQSPSLD